MSGKTENADKSGATIAPIRTLNINLYAAPGVGKSATSTRLISLLKLRNHSVELVPEYSKELHWEGRLESTEQMLITSEQWRRQSILQGKVQIAVTDNALGLGAVYAPESYQIELQHIVKTLTQNWWSLDVLLEHKDGLPENHMKKQREILEMLKRSGKPYIIETVDDTVAARIAERVNKMMLNKPSSEA